jgi:hypothetical protein
MFLQCLRSYRRSFSTALRTLRSAFDSNCQIRAGVVPPCFPVEPAPGSSEEVPAVVPKLHFGLWRVELRWLDAEQKLRDAVQRLRDAEQRRREKVPTVEELLDGNSGWSLKVPDTCQPSRVGRVGFDQEICDVVTLPFVPNENQRSIAFVLASASGVGKTYATLCFRSGAAKISAP